MKLELLKKGLQKLVDEDNNQEAVQAIAEINEIQQRVAWNDAFNGDCYVIYASDAASIMNMLTYDEYGKLYVAASKLDKIVPFNKYEAVCRGLLDLDGLPLSMIQLGFDIVGDLYADNEALDYHNPDGTFKGE